MNSGQTSAIGTKNSEVMNYDAIYISLLEKEMATHSSTLAWKIPWTEETGRLQSMGSQRVGHDWATWLDISLVKAHMLSFLWNLTPWGRPIRITSTENSTLYSMVTSNGRKSKKEEMFVYTNSSAVKNPPANAGDADLIPGSGKSGEGNSNPLQCLCLGNPMDRGAWWAIVHGVRPGLATKTTTTISDSLPCIAETNTTL